MPNPSRSTSKSAPHRELRHCCNGPRPRRRRMSRNSSSKRGLVPLKRRWSTGGCSGSTTSSGELSRKCSIVPFPPSLAWPGCWPRRACWKDARRKGFLSDREAQRDPRCRPVRLWKRAAQSLSEALCAGESAGGERPDLRGLRRPGVIGYYSLAVGGVEHSGVPVRVTRDLSQHPIPVTLLVHLAVDRTQQRRGLGEVLIKDILCGLPGVNLNQGGPLVPYVDVLRRPARAL